MQHRLPRGLQTVLIAAGLFAGTLTPFNASPASAQEDKPLPLTVAQTPAGVRIEYSAANGNLPTIQVGDLIVPGRQILVEMTAGASASAMQASAQSSMAVQSTAFNGEVQIAQPPVTAATEGAAAGDIQRELITTLPDSPVSIVNEGIMRGRRLATLAITPLFEQAGQKQMASAFTAILPNARLIDDPTSLMSDFAPALAEGKLQPQAEDSACDNSAPANGMLADGQTRWRIRVSQSGIVQVTASSLAAAGMPAAALGRLELINPKGLRVAIHRYDSNGNTVFDGADWIRFYAPAPGDRWNRTDTYWLSIKDAGSPDMGNPIAGSGVGSPAAFERGVYVNNKEYDSTLPGTDGDHWFAANLRAFGGTSAIWAFTPPTRLPPTGANATVQVAFGSSTNVVHSVQLASNGNGNFVNPSNAMSGAGAFTATFQIPNFQGASQFAVRPSPSTLPEVIMPDRVVWEQPVSLNNFGGNGAAFTIKGAAGGVQMNGIPFNFLYEVTNPVAPAVAPNVNGLFTHAGGDRNYVMAGDGTLITDAGISRYVPVAMNIKFNKNAVYIAPDALIGSLQGHINFRVASSFLAGAFSAENIYDWWSFGQVSPAALRNFLRHAYCTWDVKPIAVTMVGDGSADPFDYKGYNTGSYAGTNVTLIPPYLAPVDPFLVPASLGAAETACEACYAQLNNVNPLSDKLPDLLFGRIPAKNAAELSAVLSKLFAYETAPALTTGGGAWRSTVAYVNDNSRMPNGTYDPAGNFEAGTEQNIAQQPSWARINRMYYDPYLGVTNGNRTNNPTEAFNRTFSLFNGGAGIINYTGHGSIIQMAVLETILPEDPNKPWKKYLFSLSDVPNLNNTSRLPLLLQFTCLTSAFQTPVEYYGTTLDERLLLSPNGPPAIWGPTSLAVGFSHDALMRGFYNTLWSQPRFGSSIGLAAQGGYVDLFASSNNTPNVDNLLRTYLIMGDPLTRAYVGQMSQINLPITTRSK